MFGLRLAQTMGMTLHELVQRMSSQEFSQHIALAILDHQARSAQSTEPPSADELEWFGEAT
jgi:hypothetical protein